jgi:hypothetical protein
MTVVIALGNVMDEKSHQWVKTQAAEFLESRRLINYYANMPSIIQLALPILILLAALDGDIVQFPVARLGWLEPDRE